MTVCEWLVMQNHDLISDKFFTLCPDGKSASLCSGVMPESSDTLLPRFSIIFKLMEPLKMLQNLLRHRNPSTASPI